VGTAITIKGTRDGLLIALGAGEMDDLLIELTERVASQEAFFHGGEVVLQFGEHELTSQDVGRFLQVFEENGVLVRAIYGKGSTPPSVAPKPVTETVTAPPQEVDSGSSVLVQRTLRSGQSVRHAGHVVVVGDVNSGAEVIAGGDIIVWGHLRGIVHAGAMGDDERCICALDLSPTQLRIGNHIARPPEDRPRRKKSRPERAFVSNGQIVAEKCV
jgi:septum site-determining protein MinC